MIKNLFYSSKTEGKSAFLTEDEHRHCTKVLRYSKGDKLICTDGLGTKFEAHIHHISKKETELYIDYEEFTDKSEHHLHLAIGMPKSSNRLDFLIEKLVEIGVQEITPLFTTHSERKKINIERYKKKIISASTQSLQYHFPILNEPIAFKSFLENQNPNNVVVAHYASENNWLINQVSHYMDLTILIGPEGDFHKSELEQVNALGISCVNLSKHRLRTETAAIVACTIANSRYKN